MERYSEFPAGPTLAAPEADDTTLTPAAILISQILMTLISAATVLLVSRFGSMQLTGIQ